MKKLLTLCMTFLFLMTGLVVYGANTMTFAPNVSNGGNVIAKSNLIVNIKSTDSYSIVGLGYSIINSVGSLRASDLDTVPAKSAYSYRIPMPENNGTFDVVVIAKNSNGVTETQTYKYTVVNGIDNVITFTSTELSDTTTLAGGTDVHIRMTTSASTVGITNLGYKLTDSNNAVIDSDGPKDVPEEKGYDYTVSLPSTAGTYKLYVEGTDQDGKKASKTYTIVIPNTVVTENSITITSTPTSGSSMTAGNNVTVTASSTLSTVNIASIGYVLKNSAGTVISSDTKTNTTSVASLTINMPTVSGTYTLVITARDANGEEKVVTYTFTVVDGSTPTPPVTTTITITPSLASGSSVSPERDLTFTATSNNSSVGITKIEATVDGETETTTSTNGDSSLAVSIEMPEDEDDYTVTVKATNKNGTTKTEKFTYTVDEDSDDDPKEGVINDDLDDLAVDLWTTSKSRFYELDDEIGFVAYYYNAESKSKKDVVIEVEVPDGFKVVSKTTDRGTASYSSDTLKFKLGTVEKETLGQVSFVLKPEDDDLCGEITEIVATIESDDDEEDTSTQLIWVYESGDKGTFNAYITGYTDGTFRPDNGITREEVATMMARAFGHKVYSTVRTFSDISTTRWSYNYIMGCANKNIIVGYTDGTFRPLNNITRAELYTMTYKALGIDAEEKALFVPKEYKKDDSWEKNYIAGLTRLRMLEDMDDTDADDVATRAEVVYLINRVQFRNPSTKTSSTYSDVYSHWAVKDIESASVTYSYKRTASGKENIQ